MSRVPFRPAILLGLGLLLTHFAGPLRAVDEPPGADAASPAPIKAAGPVQEILAAGPVPRLRWGDPGELKGDLEQLYSLQGGQPIWTQASVPVPAASMLITALGNAAEHGLNPADYEADKLRSWLGSAPVADAAALDAALSLEAARFLDHLHRGRVKPKAVHFDLDVSNKRLDLAGLISRLADGGSIEAVIKTAEPRAPFYQNLKAALAGYRELAKADSKVRIDLPPKFKPGAHHAGVPALRRFLHKSGDLATLDSAAGASESYDPALTEAVKSFQRRNGLAADGVLGAGTLKAMNASPVERIRALELGMERLRWLPDEIPGDHILVNVPAFQLFGYREGSPLGKPDISIDVIVGAAAKQDRHTPMFTADMTYINFRPYWNVPESIIEKEYLPILRRNPGYLARNNMELVTGYSDNAKPHAASAANIARLASGGLRLRQKPGAGNALGLVKFSFPNNNNVYLHSTPNKGLFKKTRRDFSHGCIRVADPPGLAEFILANRDGWDRDRINAAFNAKDSRIVNLPKAVPVYIFYSTALADAGGHVSFYEDIYGLDDELRDALSAGFPYRG